MNINQQNFINYVQINEKIATSGHLNVDQIKSISGMGYSTIINLAPHSAQEILPNEGKIVATHFMTYVNIPVPYEDPQHQLKMFFAVMASLKDQKVWVHCEQNTEVAAFVYLYQRYEQRLSHDQALSEFTEGTPDQTWLEFFETAEIYLYDQNLYYPKSQEMFN